MNTDTVYYLQKTPDKIIQTEEREKKFKYMEAWLHKISYFFPLIVSVVILLVIKEESMLKCLPIQLSAKLWQPYLQACIYFHNMVAIKMVCATHQCIWVLCVSEIQIIIQRLQGDSGSGLKLYW